MEYSITPTIGSSGLPHKSTLWFVFMIFIVNLLIVLIGTAIAGVITSFVLVGNPNISTSPSFVALISFILVLILSVVGYWSAVGFVSKRSQILASDVTKIPLLVIGLGLVINILELLAGKSSNWLIIIVGAVVGFGILYYFIKKKVR